MNLKKISIDLILKLLLLFFSLLYLVEPMATVYAESETLLYLLKNGYGVKIILLILTLSLLVVVSIINLKKKDWKNFITLLLSLSWLIILLYDTYIALMNLNEIYFYSMLEIYKPFNNLFNNSFLWIFTSILLILLSLIKRTYPISKN